MRSAKNKTFLKPIKLGSKYGLDVLRLYRKELDNFDNESLKKFGGRTLFSQRILKFQVFPYSSDILRSISP